MGWTLVGKRNNFKLELNVSGIEALKIVFSQLEKTDPKIKFGRFPKTPRKSRMLALDIALLYYREGIVLEKPLEDSMGYFEQDTGPGIILPYYEEPFEDVFIPYEFLVDIVVFFDCCGGVDKIL